MYRQRSLPQPCACFWKPVLSVNMQLTLQGKSAEKGAEKTPENGSKSPKADAAAPLLGVSPGSLVRD